MHGPRFTQIRASAGSGKTFALTRRFLELLRASRAFLPPAACGAEDADGFAWPEIMAVTFTNKASTEMKERVVASLKGRALGLEALPARPWTPEQAGIFLERILRHYHLLNVRTIDSLLSRLVQMFSLDLGLPPDFEAVFDEEELFGPLYDALLAMARDPARPEAALLEQAVDALVRLDHVKGFWLQDRLRTRLKSVFGFLLRTPCEPISDAAELATLLAGYHADLARSSGALAQALEEQGITPTVHFRKFLEHCRQASPEDQPKSDSRQATYPSLASCVLKAGHGLLSPALEQAYDDFKTQFSSYCTMWAALNGAGRLAPFLLLANRLLNRLSAQERELGLVLAAAWPMLVDRLLNRDGGVPEAFCRLGVSLRHLLLDEFQDTSRDQWRAVLPLAEECLSRGGSLLYVGDVKQAIYGWRGGEARLFEEVAEEASLTAMCALEQEELAYNWRSWRQVVEFNNDLFGLLESQDHAQAVAETLLPSSAPEEIKALLADDLRHSFANCRQLVPDKHRATMGLVRVRTVAAGSSDELEEETRELLSALLEELHQRGRSWDELAILVRSNTQAGLVAGWLLEDGVPVVTENSLELAGHPLIRQLVALLAFLDYPLDGLAFWELVQGEELFLGACGLDRQDLADWLTGQDAATVAWRFRRDFPELWDAWLKPFLFRAGLMSPYDLVTRALDIFGILRRRPEDEPFAQRFLEVLHRAEERGYRSLSTFLDHWRRKGDQERLPMPEHVDAVRVMTIHKAKGLEYPVAIVPFHHWTAGPDLALEVVGHGEAEPGLLVPVRKELGPIYWQRQCQNLLEQMNLLYVAWTRASQELHAFVPPPGLKRSAMAGALDLLLDLAGRGQDEAVLERGQAPRLERRVSEPNDFPGPTFFLQSAPERRECRESPKHPEEAGNPASSPAGSSGGAPESMTGPARQGDTERQDSGTTAPVSSASVESLVRWLPRLKVYRNFSLDTRYGFTESERGNVFHAALEHLANLGPDSGDPASAGLVSSTAMDAAVAEALSLYPLPRELSEQAAADLRQGLEWFASLPQARPWLHHGRPEAGLLAADGRVLRMDLFVEFERELHVIDFKTGQPAPEHRTQVMRYMRLAARADGRPVRGYLVYLDGREVREIIPGAPDLPDLPGGPGGPGLSGGPDLSDEPGAPAKGGAPS